jgi:hypothetical protein
MLPSWSQRASSSFWAFSAGVPASDAASCRKSHLCADLRWFVRILWIT